MPCEMLKRGNTDVLLNKAERRGARGGGHRGDRMDLCGVADKAADEQALKKGRSKRKECGREIIAWRNSFSFCMAAPCA